MQNFLTYDHPTPAAGNFSNNQEVSQMLWKPKLYKRSGNIFAEKRIDGYTQSPLETFLFMYVHLHTFQLVADRHHYNTSSIKMISLFRTIVQK
jgi:hypothetical protein